MSTVDHFSSIFDDEMNATLKKNNIRTVLDFLNETPESIGKILKLRFKDVIDIREKVVDAFREKPTTALGLVNQIRRNRFTLPTGIPQIDMLIGGLENGHIYEVCGLSGSGKTQLCLNMAAHASVLGKRVLFVDTKNDFSASRVLQILKKKSFKDMAIGMERIEVTRVFNLYELVDVLHYLQNINSYPFSLVIVDCVSTCYFTYVGGDKPIGYAMLNHIASVMKHIVTKNQCVFVLTNLATENFHARNNILGAEKEKSIKPCLGSYWQQISNLRLDLKRIDNFTISVSVGRSDSVDSDSFHHIDLLSL